MNLFEHNKIKVGISSCLVGFKVRFDGGHKRSGYCEKVLSSFFDFQPICPEMGIGLGTPRKTIRLVRSADNVIKVVASDGSFDVTDKLKTFAEETSADLNHISGYIFCAKSPSCGMERVTVYKEGGNQGARDGIGLFAEQIMQDHPLLPVEEDGRLNDTKLRENFITRVLAYHKWQSLMADGVTKHALTSFHAQHKYLLMAHDPNTYKTLGPLLGENALPLEEMAQQYIEGFMSALKHIPTRKGHANTLQHLQGYFKKQLNSQQRVDLAEQIDKYRQGLLPLMAPITLIKHYLTQYPDEYLSQQVYLNPHPEELKLRYEH